MQVNGFISMALIVIITAVSSLAIAAPKFSIPIILADKSNGDTDMTAWTGYLISSGYEKKIALYAKGRASTFEGRVSINCKEPGKSSINTANKPYRELINASLRDAMETNVIPQIVINNMFAKFCK